MSDQTPEDAGKWCNISKEKRDTRYEYTRVSEPPEGVRELSAGQGKQRGGKRMRDNGRYRHVAKGAETRGISWHGAGLEVVYVYGTQ